MDWYPNEDAILEFSARIWPRLKAARPGISMTVIGRNPSERLMTVARAAGIALTGTVPDVRPHIDQGAVYVVPLRVGGGTRLKILEAMAMAKPVVSTTIGAEGLTLTPDRDFVAADGDEAFTNAVLNLLDHPDRAATLGAAGRRLVEERHAWDRVALEFERSMDYAVRNRRAARTTAPHRVAVSSR
jgi:glycosyltransferase involved in cell wall biosynthesis